MINAANERRIRIAHRLCAGFVALLLVMPALPVAEGSASEFPVADLVIVEKSKRKLHLVRDGETFRTFRIALGIRPVGDKTQEGDFRTPEGRYILDSRNPNSEYFLSIHVSYPNQADRLEANRRGVDPGGAIMIHGQPNEPSQSETYYRTQDWTNGCIAVSNSDMIDIWLMTGENTPIEIRP
ncbi:MAG: L,D-transpeptidase family protein [Woeseiaceae bacterium]|nr:L,D-transpeptidase family protein [Woeseiaceae bacterium]